MKLKAFKDKRKATRCTSQDLHVISLDIKQKNHIASLIYYRGKQKISTREGKKKKKHAQLISEHRDHLFFSSLLRIEIYLFYEYGQEMNPNKGHKSDFTKNVSPFPS